VTGAEPEFRQVGIIGMGYVGLTLAAALARRGYEVHGVDTQPELLDTLSKGRPHIFEPGVEDVFREWVGRRIFLSQDLPGSGVDAAIICVSTPVGDSGREPYLLNLAAAAEHIAKRCTPETLVVVRSTVPVGATRSVVLPRLVDAWGSARLVMAPERTIQGQALRELVELPQVVGGVDEESLRLGLALFGGLSAQLVPVSGLETAELVKLVNNCHTDVIYSFGNEVARLTERLGLDPLEVINATNVDYPRPDIAKPGYVGGGCLSKDPYLLLSAGERAGHVPPLIKAAREVNEDLPAHVAERVLALMGEPGGKRLLVLGWAYKGWPPTDDMRGTPIASMMPAFTRAGVRVLGHDPLVGSDVIMQYGGEPTDLETGFAGADAVLVITDHPEYRRLDIDRLLPGSDVRLVYDSWRVLDEDGVTGHGVRYAGLGYEPAVAR
jgi:UDP-N-acetyl-D-mannosaminuronic acid dehydrogenase